MTDGMDLVYDVPVKISIHPVVLLLGGMVSTTRFRKVVAVLIAALLLLPLHERVVGGQITHAVMELACGVAFPIRAAGNEVANT